MNSAVFGSLLLNAISYLQSVLTSLSIFINAELNKLWLSKKNKWIFINDANTPEEEIITVLYCDNIIEKEARARRKTESQPCWGLESNQMTVHHFKY